MPTSSFFSSWLGCQLFVIFTVRIITLLFLLLLYLGAASFLVPFLSLKLLLPLYLLGGLPIGIREQNGAATNDFDGILGLFSVFPVATRYAFTNRNSVRGAERG